MVRHGLRRAVGGNLLQVPRSGRMLKTVLDRLK